MPVAVIRVKGSRRPKNAWRDLGRRVTANANQAAYNYARAVVKEAKLRVPVRTGYLRSQIKWERNGPGDFTIFVDGDPSTRTGAFYGVYVEYGTRNMAARPYFTPAVHITKVQFMADMKAVFR
jgi:HK97 gp10 family phage protein